MRKKVWLPSDVITELWRYGKPSNVVSKLLKRSMGDYIGWDFRVGDRQGDHLVTLDIDDEVFNEAWDTASEYGRQLNLRSVLCYIVKSNLLGYYMDGDTDKHTVSPSVLAERAQTTLKLLVPHIKMSDVRHILNDAISILEELKNGR